MFISTHPLTTICHFLKSAQAFLLLGSVGDAGTVPRFSNAIQKCTSLFSSFDYQIPPPPVRPTLPLEQAVGLGSTTLHLPLKPTPSDP
jgi:hypothetical protein